VRRTLQPLAVLLVALVVVAALAVAIALPPSDNGDPSSRSAGKLGTLALYTWLGRLGLSVSRLSGTFDLGATDVLVDYDPSVHFSAAELDSVMRLVRGGGDLVLVFDALSIDAALPLLQRIGAQVAGTLPPGTATPAQPFDPADRVHTVPTGGGFALLERTPLVSLLRSAGRTVAGGVRVGGGGRAWVVADSAPLSNDGLRHGDSAFFVLSLLERARGGRIAFDEFHHGEGATSGGAASIFAGPVGGAALLVTGLVVVFLAVNGRRVGRPVAAGDEATVPSAATYIDAMGELFARSRQRGAIAQRYADELRRRVGAATGVDPALADAAFIQAVASNHPERADALQALLARARALATGRPDEGALLRLARDVDAFERSWAATPQWRA